MTKHTPGPWYYDPEDKTIWFDMSSPVTLFASVNGDDMTTDAQLDADGRIAAASPDMLEALKRALFILESPAVSPYCTPSTEAQPGTIEAARAAIAKAEGR
jgi:hypothetical protein